MLHYSPILAWIKQNFLSSKIAIILSKLMFNLFHTVVLKKTTCMQKSKCDGKADAWMSKIAFPIL
jgi:hypothetical protein